MSASISGFTFVRNAVKFDYPLVESLTSILPIVDEFIIAVGDCEDGTRELIEGIGDKKIRIIDTVWDPNLTEQSRILAQQTNIALAECRSDWGFYIQADEVFPPAGLEPLRTLADTLQPRREVEAILFDYLHFFGGYDWVARSHRWYRKEIRFIRNSIGITSYKDAQGFRLDCQKLRAFDSGIKIHHYGWVRPPLSMGAKKKYHDSIHHGHSDADAASFDYYDGYVDPKTLVRFEGEHPTSMRARIDEWPNDFDPAKIRHRTGLKDIKYRLKDWVGYTLGWFPGEYRNYRVIR